MAPLLVLHSDLWDSILSYSEENALKKLIMVGNRSLNAKLSRIRAVTIHWTRLEFCNWNKSAPFLRQFPKIFSLTLSAERSYQLSTGRLNLELLPPTLTSLKLTFANAMMLVTEGTPFASMPSLTSLYISSYEPRESADYKIDLAQFPKQLMHLTLGEEASGYPNFQLINFEQRPSNLITFKSTIVIKTTPETALTTDKQGRYSALENLAIVVPAGAALDVSFVSSTIRYLKVSTWKLFFRGSTLTRFSASEGLPLRGVFSQLHTLILPREHPPLPWHVFESLPLSLTHLEAPFELRNDTLAQSLATCEQLNREYLRSGSNDRPGAPAMLRRFRPLSNPSLSAKRFIPYFTNLESLIEPGTDGIANTDELSTRLEIINFAYVNGKISELPPRLRELTCTSLSMSEFSDQHITNQLDDSHFKLPPLRKLAIRQVQILQDVISMLPATLEELELALASNEILEMLATRANVERRLPLLTSFKLRGLNLGTVATPEPLYISASVLPASVNHLVLSGDIKLIHPDHRDSLKCLPNLTRLDIAYEELPWTILPQLPPQLRAFTVQLSHPIDLNRPELVQMLLDLPPNLTELGFGYNSTWFKPFHSLCAFPHFAGGDGFLRFLPRSLKLRLLRLASSIMSPNIIYRLSEDFIVSSLPTSVVSFTSPFPETNLSTWGPMKLVHRSLEYLFEAEYSYWPQLLLTSHLPILVPLMPSFYRLSSFDCPGYYRTLFEAFPPHLSQIVPQNTVISKAFLLQAKSRLKPTSEQTESLMIRFIIRSTFCFANILMWAYFLSSDHLILPGILRYLPWINIIGSALILPLQTRTYRKVVGRDAFNASMTKNLYSAAPLVLIALLGTVSATTTYAAAVGTGYTTSTWSTFSRVLACGVTVLGDLLLHAFCLGR